MSKSPLHIVGDSTSEDLLARLSSGSARTWEVEAVAHAHLEAGRFEAARAIFDAVIEQFCQVDPDPTGHFRSEGVRSWGDRKDRHLVRVLNNALWAIQADNTGETVSEEQARRYLLAALPYGPWNPAIYFNAACVLVERGQLAGALECVREAVRHRYSDLEGLRGEPLFEVLRGHEGFEAAFEAQPVVDWAAVAAEERARRRAEADDAFRVKAAKLVDSPEASALLQLVRDLSGSNELVGRVRDRLRDPPRTAEEIGFYPGANDNPFERCFRFAVSQLDGEGLLMACEDKYSYQLFEHLGRHIELPEGVNKMLVDGVEGAGFMNLAQELEARFVEARTPLRMLWTGGGDHLYFVAVAQETADGWTNRVIGRTHAGEPLGLCRPRWDVLYAHLGYALGWPYEEEAPSGWEPVVWRSS